MEKEENIDQGRRSSWQSIDACAEIEKTVLYTANYVAMKKGLLNLSNRKNVAICHGTNHVTGIPFWQRHVFCFTLCLPSFTSGHIYRLTAIGNLGCRWCILTWNVVADSFLFEFWIG